MGDLSRVHVATEILENPAVEIGGVAPELTQITSVERRHAAGRDRVRLEQISPTTAARTATTTGYMYDTEQHFQGGETAGRLDVTYSIPSGFITSVQGGVRIARRTDDFHQWTAFGAVTTAGIQGNSKAGSVKCP